MTSSELIIAGWVPAQEVPTPSVLGESLPRRLLTISDCIQPDLPRPDFRYGDWFQDREEAQVALTGTPLVGVEVLTVAMDSDDAADFMGAWDSQPAPWFDLLKTERSLRPDVVLEGWEVVGAECYLDFHSWHRHGYAEDVAAHLGIPVTARGLLRSREDARRVLEWMRHLPADEAPKEVPWTTVVLAS